MKNCLLSLLFIFILCACNTETSIDTPTPISKQKRSTRIVGGEPANGNWPWMAALIDQSPEIVNPFCGAALINPSWVITAAHCVENETINTFEVFIGSDRLNSENAQRIPVKQMIIHPDYNTDTVDSDLALLELSRSLDDIQTLSTIPKNIDIQGLDGVIMGWGKTGENKPKSDILLQATVPLVSDDACYQVFGDDLTDNMVCAGELSATKDSCYGDSGGPLVVFIQDRYYLAGIVSWGEGCARNGYYGVYTRVSSFDSFIHDCISFTSWKSEIVAQTNQTAENVYIGADHQGYKQPYTNQNPSQILDFYLIDTNGSAYSQMIHAETGAKIYTWIMKIEYRDLLIDTVIELSWPQDEFSTEGHYILLDGYDLDGDILVDNMRTTDSFTFVHHKLSQENLFFTICWIVESQIEIPIKKGWNMVSFPHTPFDATDLLQDKLIYMFHEGAYIQPRTLVPGKGYWLLSSNDEPIVINGTPKDSWSQELSPGWHLIGSTDQPSTLQSNPQGCIDQIASWQDGYYRQVNEIEPGRGYFIKLNQSCQLVWKTPNAKVEYY